MKKSFAPLTLACAAAFCGFSAFATDYYVAMDGVDAEGRGAADAPFASLEFALSKAVNDGDKVLINTGTYTLAKTTADTKLIVSVGVTIASISGNPEDVILKKDSQRLIKLNHADAVLSGVTLQGGTSGDTTSYETYDHDGVSATIASGTVTNCILRGASYGNNGRGRAAVSLESDKAKLLYSVVSNNTCDTTGSNGPVEVRKGIMKGCLVCDNGIDRADHTLTGGSGCFTGGTVEDCVFTRNRSRGIAGVYSKGATVTNCIIWDNYAQGDIADGRDVWGGTAANFNGCVARIAINDSCTATTDPGRYGPQMKVVEGLNFTASVTRAIVPFEVTFTAVEGAAPYTWDFGDGSEIRETAEPTVTYTYEKAGVYTPSVTCGGVTADRPGLIEAMGTKMYVKKNNANTKFPYATQETAAATPMDAADRCIDGQEILLEDGDYPTPWTVSIGRAVTFRSLSGDRDKVILNASDNKVNIRSLQVNHPQARVEGLTSIGRGLQVVGASLYLFGGAVSNCVFRNGSISGYGANSMLEVTGVDALLTHCWVTNNTASCQGVEAATSVRINEGGKVVNCFIADNKENTPGSDLSSGVWVKNGTLENCTVVNNQGQRTGGVRATAGRVVNCVIAGNTSRKRGAGYHDVEPGSDNLFDHCAVAEVKLGGSNVNYHDSMANMFEDAAHGDFLPAGGSCLVDKGLTPEEPEATDLAGSDRVMGTAIDIGCYERPTAGFAAHVSADVAEGLLPLTVTFTATAEGTNGTDDVVFVWDFDDDGEFEVTNRATRVTHVYAGAGRQTVSLKALNLTTGAETEVETKPDFINVVPKVLHVLSGNADAAYPYDSETNAAATIAAALAVAIDNVTVLVHPETYPNVTMMTIGKEVTVRGATDNPADVVVKPAKNGVDYIFKLDNPKALVCNLMVEGNTARALIGNDTQGGTVSNCIVRAFKTNSTWALGPVWLTTPGSLATHLVVSNCDASTSGPDPWGTSYADAVAGGIRLTGGARAENCLVVGCAAKNNEHGTGGILLLGKSSAVNCTVAHCIGREVGGCCASSFKGYPNTSVITNCLFVDTSATMEGGAAVVNADQLDRCVTCAADVDVADGWQKGTPGQFFRNDARRDFRPPNSAAPLYRTGTFVPHIYAERDLIGRPRKQNGCLDIGCYDVKATGLMLLVK